MDPDVSFKSTVNFAIKKSSRYNLDHNGSTCQGSCRIFTCIINGLMPDKYSHMIGSTIEHIISMGIYK